MRLKHITLAAMCMVCTAAFANQSSLQVYGKHGISRMFLDAHAPDQPPRYSRSEIKQMIHDATDFRGFRAARRLLRLSILEFKQKANEQVKELERLLALPFHARTYATQVEYTRELIKKYRTKADECSSSSQCLSRTYNRNGTDAMTQASHQAETAGAASYSNARQVGLRVLASRELSVLYADSLKR